MFISNTTNIEELFQDAVILQKSGDEAGAFELYEELLNIDKNHIAALCNLSIIYKEAKNYSKTLSLLNRALAIEPKNILALKNFAKLYQSIDADNKAIEILNFAINIKPQDATLHNELAIVYERVGELAKAFDSYKYAIKLDPGFVKAYNNIGVMFYKQNRFQKAIEIFEIAKSIDSSYIGTYVNLGASLNRAKRYKDAKVVLEKAIELDSKNSGSYINLGNVLNKLNEHKRALECHQKALEMEPDSSSSYANIAITYKNLKDFKKSKDAFLKAIELNPSSVNAHFDFSTLLLLTGEYERGFKEYEWRFKKSEMLSFISENKNILEKTRFKKVLSSQGKTLLLFGEQGFGDNIQFVRYVKLLKEDYPKMKILLQCRAELKSLFKELSYIDEVISRDEELPYFDYQLSLMSLPHFFKTTKDTIAKMPAYIEIKERELFLDIDKNMINIGLVWGGSNTNENHINRVLDLKKFMPILNHKKINVFSLQVGEDAKSIKKLGLKDDKLVDLSDKLSDFKTTALVIKQLDLVISSDTSVAHLAGSLGAKTWVMLQFIPDWRWMMHRKNSPWYPSMKLFRQSKKGEWDDVYDEVFKALEKKFKIDIKRD